MTLFGFRNDSQFYVGIPTVSLEDSKRINIYVYHSLWVYRMLGGFLAYVTFLKLDTKRTCHPALVTT